jgi:hypothetical protein
VRPDGFWRAGWRGMVAIAAAYVAFLLFAQFGFLGQAQRELGDAGLVRAVMAAMGIGGLAASLGTAALLGRVPGLRLVRAGLGAVAAVAVASVASHGLPGLLAAGAAIGASLGLLTVAVAASLPELVPRSALGRAAGLATGAAYLVSNVPALFEADPAVRALFPAALALAALALAPGRAPADPGPAARRSPAARLLPLLIVFLVLIWLDSAAFAVIQADPELKARTWGSAGQKLVQGASTSRRRWARARCSTPASASPCRWPPGGCSPWPSRSCSTAARPGGWPGRSTPSASRSTPPP